MRCTSAWRLFLALRALEIWSIALSPEQEQASAPTPDASGSHVHMLTSQSVLVVHTMLQCSGTSVEATLSPVHLKCMCGSCGT